MNEIPRTHHIGIDPGSSSGAITELVANTTCPCVECFNMPEDYLGIFQLLRELQSRAAASGSPLHVTMEDVGGSRPGNSAKSARTFAEHVGALKMAIAILGFPCTLVLPRKWMFGLFKADYPSGSDKESKARRKQYIVDRMQSQYPDTVFTKRQADSLALAHYGQLLQVDKEIERLREENRKEGEQCQLKEEPCTGTNGTKR